MTRPLKRDRVWLNDRIEIAYVPAAVSPVARRPKGRHVLALYGTAEQKGDRKLIGEFRSWQENYYAAGKNHTRMCRKSWVKGEETEDSEWTSGRTFAQWKKDLLTAEISVQFLSQ